MMDQGRVTFDGPPRLAFSQPRNARSEEGQPVPTSAWFPQAAEFALAVTEACGLGLVPADLPLDVPEAIAFGQGLVAR